MATRISACLGALIPFLYLPLTRLLLHIPPALPDTLAPCPLGYVHLMRTEDLPSADDAQGPVIRSLKESSLQPYQTS